MQRMENSSMDDYRTRQRRAYRAGWEAALRNKSESVPNHKDTDLDSHWLNGFREGKHLREDWDAEKAARAE
jgi:ribosome modulation factor